MKFLLSLLFLLVSFALAKGPKITTKVVMSIEQDGKALGDVTIGKSLQDVDAVDSLQP